MLKMVFQTTASMIIERGAATRLAEHVQAMGCTSVLVVTDAGVIAARLLDAVLASFENSPVAVRVFSQVQADPPESVIQIAVDVAKACAADCVLGLGEGVRWMSPNWWHCWPAAVSAWPRSMALTRPKARACR